MKWKLIIFITLSIVFVASLIYMLYDKDISYESYELDKKFIYLSELFKSIILSGDNMYNSTDTNITQDKNLARLNISLISPYDTLLLYFPFDTDRLATQTIDYSKYDKNGTLSNVYFNTDGKYGAAYDFNDSDEITTISIFSNYTPNFTISSWVKFNYNGTNNHFVFGRLMWAINDRTPKLQYNENTDSLTFSYRSGSSSSLIINNLSTKINVSQWNNIIVTWELGRNISIYANGVLLGNKTAPSTPHDWAAGATGEVGRSAIDGLSLKGSIDEFMIFNSTLNSSQLSDIYNNQSNRFLPRGELEVREINLGENNTANISIRFAQAILATNLSLKMNGGSTVNIELNSTGSGNVYNYNVPGNSTNTNLTIIFTANSNSFYSPNIGGNITIDSWFVAAASNTCTYTSGNWNVACNDNCTITTNINLGNNNLTINGTGTFTLMGGNISGYNKFNIWGNSPSQKCQLYQIGGRLL